MNCLASRTLGRGPRVVLIPGWAMHSGVWGEFADCLAADCCVTCVDLPGHGLSSAWTEWTLAATAKALAGLVQEQALWLGWSLGGQVALELALRYPTQVKGLILIATNPRFLAQENWPGMAPEVFESFAHGVEADAQATLARFLALSCLGVADAKRLLRQLQTRWGRYPPPTSGVLRQGLEILRQTDLRPALTGIACPVTVVAGSEDRLVPVEAARRLVAGLPRARLILLDKAGHALCLSHPQTLAALVREAA